MITLYSTDCPNCKVLKRKLEEKGIEYELVTDMQAMLSHGFRAAPMLEVDGKAMNFSEAMKWVRED